MILELIVFVITIISTIMAYHNVDEMKRVFLINLASISFAFFITILIFGNLAVYGIGVNEDEKINQQELIILSKYNMEKENIERSVMYLEKLNQRLQEGDVRKYDIDKQIDSLKKVQVKLK